jgi:lysophospholipase L1-like esterase
MKLAPLSKFFVVATIFAALSAPAVRSQEAKSNTAINPVARHKQNWTARHEAMNARVKKGNVDLIFISDSITQGWERSGNEVWKKFYDKRNAVNLGISADKTQHVLWRLGHGNLEGISPKLAGVMIGTNNARIDPPEHTAEAIKAIVAMLRTKLPKTKILLLGIFPRGVNNKDNRRLVNEKVNLIISKLDDGGTVFYLDIGPKFLAADGTLSKDIMPDMLHPNAKGYEIWADAIEPKVAELMGEK